MDFYCGNNGCPNWAALRCSKCVQIGMPNAFGQYCSRDCQLKSYHYHNCMHAMVDNANRSVLSFQGLAESIALAMKDASTRYLLPDLGESQTVSILLAGCRDFVEGSVDFYVLYELLVALDVFPDKNIQYLEVTLCGPELTSRGPVFHPSGRVKVFRASGRLQRQFPASTTNTSIPDLSVGHFSSTMDKVNGSQYVSFNTYNGAPAVASAAALYDIFSCVFIREPGFSIGTAALQQRSPQKEGIVSMLEQWAPAINLLMETGVLVLVAEYPDRDVDTLRAPTSPLSSNILDRYGHLPPVNPSPLHSKSLSEKKSSPLTAVPLAASSDSEKLSNTQLPTIANLLIPENPVSLGAEYFLDVHFHAKIVIPASPYPFRRQKWSTPFPSMIPDQAAVPHSEVYEPLSQLVSGSTGFKAGSTPRSPSDSSPTPVREGYYLAFQGKRDPQVTQQIQFFSCMAQLNAPLRGTCELIARELGTGILQLPLHWAPEELELEAHRRDMSINPLKKQLLEKEKQAIMRMNSPSPSANPESVEARPAGSSASQATLPALQFTRRKGESQRL